MILLAPLAAEAPDPEPCPFVVSVTTTVTLLPLEDPEARVDIDVITSVTAPPVLLPLIEPLAATPAAPLAGEVEVTITRTEPELPDGRLDALLEPLEPLAMLEALEEVPPEAL